MTSFSSESARGATREWDREGGEWSTRQLGNEWNVLSFSSLHYWLALLESHRLSTQTTRRIRKEWQEVDASTRLRFTHRRHTSSRVGRFTTPSLWSTVISIHTHNYGDNGGDTEYAPGSGQAWRRQYESYWIDVHDQSTDPFRFFTRRHAFERIVPFTR